FIQMVKRKVLVPIALLFISVAGIYLYLFWPKTPLPPGAKADKVIVVKHEKKLMLVKDGKVLKTYKVALGSREGRKVEQGDHKTPEGVYKLYRLYKNDDSRCHTALRITYPNENDKGLAEKLGITNLGGDIEIHGMGKYGKMFPGGLERLHWLTNWTGGCIAVTDAEADEIYDAVPNGTTIEIQP
ncbi:MAG: L,D-transpeptidase family protein, partial [Candidatus Ranarchaeia archaeon]